LLLLEKDGSPREGRVGVPPTPAGSPTLFSFFLILLSFLKSVRKEPPGQGRVGVPPTVLDAQRSFLSFLFAFFARKGLARGYLLSGISKVYRKRVLSFS